MKHGKLPKNPSAQFKATIMDFDVPYEKSAPLTSHFHHVIQKFIKNSILCHLPFLNYCGRHKHSFACFFCVFTGCHGNQVPFLIFLMFLQLTIIQVFCLSTF